jgi:large subunit ribosomal protein L31
MRKDTHPDYHIIKVKMTNGDIVEMKSTWGSEGDQIALDIDPSAHPAWTGGNTKLMDTGGRRIQVQKQIRWLGLLNPPHICVLNSNAAPYLGRRFSLVDCSFTNVTRLCFHWVATPHIVAQKHLCGCEKIDQRAE